MGKLRNEELFDNRTNVRQAVRRALYMGSAAALAGSLMMVGPAVAQDEEDDELEEIVVTGSRLARSGFDSAAPMDVVNVQDAISLGYTDVNEMLISTPALAGSDQMTDVLSGIVDANGGEGVQTADLRGLGAGRTLSLINGRRAGPAGIRDGVGSFDINVIPLAGLERIEILKDGASSIYGSDAIGGVINYITRKGDGGEINAYTQIAEETGGEILTISGSYGRESDRGYWRVTAAYDMQEQLQKGDREIFDCQQHYRFNEPSLETRADLIDPRTDEYKCYGFNAGTIYLYDYNYYAYTHYAYDHYNYEWRDDFESNAGRWRAVYDYDGSIAASGLLPHPSTEATNPGHLRMPEGFYILPSGNNGLRWWGTSSEFDGYTTMVPERERATIMAAGEFDVSDEITLYAEALFNRRETEHLYVGQTWSYQYTSNWGLHPGGTACDGWSDCFDYDYYSYRSVDVGNGDPMSVGWTGAFWMAPSTAYKESTVKTRVDYTRVVLGAAGGFGESDWNFDVSLQYSVSDGDYLDGVPLSDSWNAGANMVALWGGDHLGTCEGTTFDRRGQTIDCVTLNFLDPRVMAGNFTDQESDFLFAKEQGNTNYKNMAFDIGFTNNELFSLPAGDLGLAVGAQFMKDEIDDVPGIESLSCNVWWEGVGQCQYRTFGETDTKAAYIETAVPLLAGKPGFDDVELSASARYTEVGINETEESAARDFSDTTYKVGLNWAINDNFRFRANVGTSFRTPALFELYRENFTQGFSQRNDPCQAWGRKLADGDIDQQTADNCASEGIPDDMGPSTLNADVLVGGGAAVLEAETAESTAFGLVFTTDETNFRMSVDYWEIEVQDQIGIFSAQGIVDGCYGSETFPNDQLCSYIVRDDGNVGGVEAYRLYDIQSSYINLDVQRTAGWDIEANWFVSLPNEYDLTIRTAHTIVTEKETESAIGEVTSRLGRAGNPEWVGNLTFRLDKGPWSGNWRMNYVDGTDNNREDLSTSGTWTNYDGDQETYYLSRTLSSRLYHNASVSYRFGEGWEANLSVTNLLDEKPPRASRGAQVRIQGYGAFYSQYDWKGRRWGLNINKVF